MDWGKEARAGEERKGGGDKEVPRGSTVRCGPPQPPRVNYIPGKPYRIILAPRRGFVQTVGTSPYRCSRARGYESLKSLWQEEEEGGGGGRGEREGRKSFRAGISPSDYTRSELFACQSCDHSW